MSWDETTPPNGLAETQSDSDADGDLRARLLARFEQRLDEALAAEEPPAGLAPEIMALVESDSGEAAGEGECSLHALWSAMTALTQEIKLQGRAFKQLNDTLEPLAADTPAVREAQQRTAEQTQRLAESIQEDREARTQEAAREAERRARTDMAEVLIDIRERMARGLGAAQSYTERVQAARRIRQYESIADAAPSLQTGYRLSLEYVDEVLGRLGVREIRCDGKPFDPHLMKAVDVEETDQAPEGTVLEVYRAGYEWNGDLFRLAEVKVARQPPPKPEPESFWARVFHRLAAVFRR